MPDRRRHRGAHPKDREHFSELAAPALRLATEDLSWLLSHGYKVGSALALVGDRHTLRARQRLAVQRSACSDAEREARGARRVDRLELASRRVLLDGFNCVIAIESALAGGVLLVGRDGVLRDMASVHGSYRKVEETIAALDRIASTLRESECREAIVYFDKPVSNSGRLAALARERLGAALPTTVILEMNPDRRLIEEGGGAIVCSGDSVILDGCEAWLDLPSAVIERGEIRHWRLDLRVEAPSVA